MSTPAMSAHHRPHIRNCASLLPALWLWASTLVSAETPVQLQQGLDTALASGQYGPVNSLLIEQRGQLLYEQYFRGTGADDLQQLNSLTKSIGSLLVGIAVRRQLLDFAAPLPVLLPGYDWSQPTWATHARLDLHHVLSMRTGLRWDELSTNFLDARNSAVQMYASPDWYRYTLGKAQDAAPGSLFNYNTGTATLLGAVLRQAAGRKPQQLFRQWLAEPLAIAQFDWELWHPQGRGHGLRSFPFDEAPLGVGLWLRPRDVLKIGRLVLDEGVYRGQRLFDADWLKRSWTPYSSKSAGDPHFAPGSEENGYGYQWWFRAFRLADGDRVSCWFASGAGRQYLVVCPELELLVVSTADAYTWTGPGVFNLLREQILPMAKAQPSPAPAGLETDGPLLQVLTGCCSFGWAIADLADIDGDARTDLIVGANASGRVHVYSGATGVQKHVFELAGSDLGYALADAGDVDGDGTSDIVAGSPAFGGRGAARVYSGRSGQLLLSIDGSSAGAQLGSAVSGIDDLDGDGRAELALGAQGEDAVQIHAGRDGRLLRRIEGASGSRFGAGLARVPDVDGDGRADLIIGAPGGSGAAHVHGSASGARVTGFAADSANAQFGEFFVASAGDVDADGRADFYVGAYNAGNGNGAAYVFAGSDGRRLHKFIGTGREGMGPGRGAGDVDGDGHADLVVGSYTYAGAGLPQGGRVTIFSGRDGSVLRRFEGNIVGGQTGFDAVGMGDLDGDGRLDFAVASAPANKVELVAGELDSGLGQRIGYGHTGAWFNAATAGQGFTIEVLPARQELFVAWYLYGRRPGIESGQEHRWLTAQGRYQGASAELTVFQSTGGVFARPGDISTRAVGTLKLRFSSCTEGVADYRIESQAVVPGAGGDLLEGRMLLQRLTPVVACAGAAAKQAVQPGHTGAWYQASTSGQGFTLEVLPGRRELFVAWYLYAPVPGLDTVQQQRWLTAQGPYDGDRATLAVSLTTGGVFAAPGAVQTRSVGQLQLRFETCTRASASYRLDPAAVTGVPQAGAAELMGGMQLERLTPVVDCTEESP